MVTYGPSSNTFMGQIGPFIDMYIRRTVSNGSNPIKSSLNRCNIFHFQIYDRNACTRKIVIFLELAGGLGQSNHPIMVFDNCKRI